MLATSVSINRWMHKDVVYIYTTHMYTYNGISFAVVQLLNHVQLFVTPWTAVHQASLPLTISQSFPKFMFIALVMPSSHLILQLKNDEKSLFKNIEKFSDMEIFFYIAWIWILSYDDAWFILFVALGL